MRVFITIENKKTKMKLQNRWMRDLRGDCTNLDNLISELKEIKAEVNREANWNKLTYKDVKVIIELEKDLK